MEGHDGDLRVEVGDPLCPLAEIVPAVADVHAAVGVLEQIHEDLPAAKLEVVPVVLDDGAEHVAAYREQPAHHVLGSLLAVNHEEQLAVGLDQLRAQGPLEPHGHPAVPLADTQIGALVHLGDDASEGGDGMLEVAVHAHGVVGVCDLEPLEDRCTEPPRIGVADIECDQRVVEGLDLLPAAVGGVVIHEEDFEIRIFRPDRPGYVGDVLLLVVCGNNNCTRTRHVTSSDDIHPVTGMSELLQIHIKNIG